jgi:hypothetical protein
MDLVKNIFKGDKVIGLFSSVYASFPSLKCLVLPVPLRIKAEITGDLLRNTQSY